MIMLEIVLLYQSHMTRDAAMRKLRKAGELL